MSDVSVVICAYTERRWEMLCAAVESVRQQTVPPCELIVCIDHNEILLGRSRAQVAEWMRGSPFPIEVIANKYDGRLGAARNSGVDLAAGAVVAFLDDDAVAEVEWLAELMRPYEDPSVAAVGGAPLPLFETARPRWFPAECDWVFGCAYEGLPRHRAPLKHLIGANMSVRLDVLRAVEGFHSDDHDDMDMCHRVGHRYGPAAVIFEPRAVVRHRVTAERVRWSYFWRRCYSVNKGKVAAFQAMGAAANMAAETEFVCRSIVGAARRVVADGPDRRPDRMLQLGALLVGIGLAGVGNTVGRAEGWRSRS